MLVGLWLAVGYLDAGRWGGQGFLFLFAWGLGLSVVDGGLSWRWSLGSPDRSVLVM